MDTKPKPSAPVAQHILSPDDLRSFAELSYESSMLASPVPSTPSDSGLPPDYRSDGASDVRRASIKSLAGTSLHQFHDMA
jgi:hypothetical protein